MSKWNTKGLGRRPDGEPVGGAIAAVWRFLQVLRGAAKRRAPFDEDLFTMIRNEKMRARRGRPPVPTPNPDHNQMPEPTARHR